MTIQQNNPSIEANVTATVDTRQIEIASKMAMDLMQKISEATSLADELASLVRDMNLNVTFT